MASAADSPFHLFGIRHHGPGCARSLVAALEALQPDCLLVEGPPEGEAMLPLLLDAGLVPPVALLIYNPEDSREAAFYPFAEFSPEWNALRHGMARGIPTRLIDLPVGHQFALARPPAAADGDGAPAIAPAAAEKPAEPGPSGDPLDWLGRAAGYGDGEAWWNHLVEERCDSLELFAAIREAMATVRSEASSRPADESAVQGKVQREALREAHMRKCLRQAQKEGFRRIAVVCGAWHVSALAPLPPAKADQELLNNLPRIKVEATWVPWSYVNLSLASGYGAGVAAPGWYEHLWRAAAGGRAVGWLARAARLFRDEDIDCSSAHVIEAVRLAETLAALRERPQPGLDELREALKSVVCQGDETPLRLIERRLVVGERLGSTPAQAPAVPLQRDLAQQQKSLRLKLEANEKAMDLDLRQPTDLARSHLFHRLALLGIGWAVKRSAGRGAKGSFHELWALQWDPSFALQILDAGRWGNSVEAAATAKAVASAASAQTLPELSALIEQVLLADLADAVGPVAQALDDLAAVAGDIGQLLAAIPPLAQVARYGNVRQTDAGMVGHLLARLVPRAAIGLAGACASLDDAAAEAMRAAILAAHQAIGLLGRDELSEEWLPALGRLARLDGGHGLVCGLAARLLFDGRVEGIDATARRVSQALSVAVEPALAAAWLEGFLNRSAMVLLHDDELWCLVDAWLGDLGDEHFLRVLPLLRRAFAAFAVPERRQLGERSRRSGRAPALSPPAAWDPARAERALPLLRQILGVAP